MDEQTSPHGLAPLAKVAPGIGVSTPVLSLIEQAETAFE